ncbi:MAG: hypothetical protein JSU72_17295, partial [Deltaproteobacteria bacterium]
GYLNFVDDGCKAVGCGENYPIDTPRQDNYRSDLNRRVEILFFDPEEKPKLKCTPQPGGCTPATCLINNRKVYRYEHIECEPVLRRVWVNLQTVDELGYKLPKTRLRLEPVGGEPKEESTNKEAYWEGHVDTAGNIRITLADGTVVRFGAGAPGAWIPSTGAEGETASLDPRVARPTVTDIVVKSISEDQRAERRQLVKRYGRTPAGSPSTLRSGYEGKHEGEKAQKMHNRGRKEEDRYTRRNWGAYATDNLFIVAGWDSSGNYTDVNSLAKVVRIWFSDCHPTVAAKGYFITFLMGSKVVLCSDKFQGGEPERLGEYRIRANLIARAALGVYADFELPDTDGKRAYRDMNTGMHDIIADPNPNMSKEAQKKAREYLRRVLQERGVIAIPDLLTDGDRKTYESVASDLELQGKLHIAYQLGFAGVTAFVSRHGGTGLLENYPVDKVDNTVNGNVHERNKSVVRNCRLAHNSYMMDYIAKVKAAKSEVALRNLGPPDPPFDFPKPVGISQEQWNDLRKKADDADKNLDLKAWVEISDKLKRLYGLQPAGTVWFDFEFSVESGEIFGQTLSPYNSGSFKYKFTIDDEFAFRDSKVEKSIKVGAGTPQGGEGGPTAGFNVEIVEDDKGNREEKVSAVAAWGPWKFKADPVTGDLEVGYGLVKGVASPRSEKVGYGVEISTKDLLERYYRWKLDLAGGAQVPPDIQKAIAVAPQLKLGAVAWFQFLRTETVLIVVCRGPGFFEMRPLPELMSVDWESLDWDERKHLTTLDWDRTSWDDKYKRSRKKIAWTITKDYFKLDAEHRVAIAHLPFRHIGGINWKSWWQKTLKLTPKELKQSRPATQR